MGQGEESQRIDTIFKEISQNYQYLVDLEAKAYIIQSLESFIKE